MTDSTPDGAQPHRVPTNALGPRPRVPAGAPTARGKPSLVRVARGGRRPLPRRRGKGSVDASRARRGVRADFFPDSGQLAPVHAPLPLTSCAPFLLIGAEFLTLGCV